MFESKVLKTAKGRNMINVRGDKKGINAEGRKRDPGTCTTRASPLMILNWISTREMYGFNLIIF